MAIDLVKGRRKTKNPLQAQKFANFTFSQTRYGVVAAVKSNGNQATRKPTYKRFQDSTQSTSEEGNLFSRTGSLIQRYQWEACSSTAPSRPITDMIAENTQKTRFDNEAGVMSLDRLSA